MTGGNDQLSYMASLGYMDQNSMFKGPDYGYKALQCTSECKP